MAKADGFEDTLLVRFGGIASYRKKCKDGYEYCMPPRHTEELDLPPVCTFPTLAFNALTGKMDRDSLLLTNGVFANAKFDNCTGELLAISHNWLVISFYVFHNQSPYNATLPEAALKSLKGFMKALKRPDVDVQFPDTPYQPKRLLAFDPLRRRATKAELSITSACRSLLHQGQRKDCDLTVVRSTGPGSAGKRSRPSGKKAQLRAAALKAPVSTRVAISMYGERLFCNGCNKINVQRLILPTRAWTINEIVRRFGSKHPYAQAWTAIAKNMTAPVVAGLCVANITAASAQRLLLHRTGTLARGCGIYLFLNYIRVSIGGLLKALVSTIFVDRTNTAAGVLACYSSKHSHENIGGQLSSLLRDKETSRIAAELGRFRFPKPLPNHIRQDAEKCGISQAWWWAAIGTRMGPKPTLSSRWIIVPNRNDDSGSHTVVCAEMWKVLDAIRGGWPVHLGLGPTYEPKDLRPRPGANGASPVHASYEPKVIKEPFPEVLCAEYATWYTLTREMENRKVASNSMDPTKFAPLVLTGSWARAVDGVTLKVPGCKDLVIKMGQCFKDLCRLAIMFKLPNFKLDLAKYSDFAAYPLDMQDDVKEQAKRHQQMIKYTLEDAAEGGKYVDDLGIASAERIFQDVHSRVSV